LSRNIRTGGTFGQGTAHDHVLNFISRNVRSLDRGLDDVATQGRSVGQVE
jgi:hypothetical protein